MQRLTSSLRLLSLAQVRTSLPINARAASIVQPRLFTTTSIIQEKLTTEKKTIKKTTKKTTGAKTEVQKAKESKKKLAEKAKVAAQKEKAKKASAKEKEKLKKEQSKEALRLKKILKRPGHVSAYNMFTKETRTKDNTFIECTQKWNVLSDNEKVRFQELADKVNKEKLQIYNEKPKCPPNGYARFLQENYNKDLPIGENGSLIAKKWQALTAEEKASWAPAPELVEAYKVAKKEWTAKVIASHSQ
ncbi:hypothetical protein CAAN1_12S03268 [[Candida] anglica]|uniref:HMG box domain-containing protein n=1 Tax=[Candida] anglica TaxID=148631 RepID=A0ABP0E6Y7_9ASCO